MSPSSTQTWVRDPSSSAGGATDDANPNKLKVDWVVPLVVEKQFHSLSPTFADAGRRMEPDALD